MAAKYVTKEHKNKQGEVVSIKYRVDAAFEPEKISDITPEFIENYCAANEEIEWLVKEVQLTITDKNGKKRDYPFVSLRADFVKKFFPEILTKRGSEESFKDRILKKYK